MFRKKHVLFTLVLVMLMSLFLSACGNDEELKVLQQENQYLKQRIEELNSQLGTSTITESVVESSIRKVDGENRLYFEKIEGDIVFPNALTVPGAKDDVNNSYIQIGTIFRYKPSNNWVTRLVGTTLELSHPSKISGTLKSIGVLNVLPEAEVRQVLQNFYQGFPSTTVNYRKVYLDTATIGLISTTTMDVEGKEHGLTVGYFGVGEYGLLLTLQYEKAEDNGFIQQELVDTLVKSIMVADRSIALEQ